MHRLPIEIGHVAFDAHARRVEALVTIHDGARTQAYPCGVDAPDGLAFGRVTRSLSQQAMRRHAARVT